jgi:hypothetical protein
LEENRRSLFFYIFTFINSSLIRFNIINRILEDIDDKNIILSSEEKYQLLLILENKSNKIEINRFFTLKEKGQSVSYIFPNFRTMYILNSYIYLISFLSEEIFKKFTFYPRIYRDNYDFIRKLKEEFYINNSVVSYISRIKIVLTSKNISKFWFLKNFPFRKNDIISIFLNELEISLYSQRLCIKNKLRSYLNTFYYLLINFFIHGIHDLGFYSRRFNKCQKMKALGSLLLMKNKDEIYFPSCSKALRKKYLSLLHTFLKIRGVKLDESFCYEVNSNQYGANIGEYNLVKNVDKKFSCLSLKNQLRNYKNRLKMIIKKNKSIIINNMITILNKELKVWKKNNFFLDNFQLVSKELDRYINKLLWRYVKRLHSRRSKVWIYKKYWRYISGNWKFVSINQTTGRIDVLLSHSFFTKSSFLNRIPLITNVFKVTNAKKIFYINFLRVKNSLTGITSLIYNKQNGLCYKCKLPMHRDTLKVIKIKKKFLILLHSICDIC